MVPLIEIRDTPKPARPIVRLTETVPGSIWRYTGAAIARSDGRHPVAGHDLNRVAEIAATRLSEKVCARGITVELVIDPLIPSIAIEKDRVLPIVTAIAENASASVEPGPGTVILRTWCRDKFVGVDAVGMNGSLPVSIRENLTRPGFTTRIADWDTGFGLHAAMEAAVAIAARIELFEPDGAVGFRLAIPIKQGTPLSPPEREIAICESQDDEGAAASKAEELSFQLLTVLGSPKDAFNDGIIQA